MDRELLIAVKKAGASQTAAEPDCAFHRGVLQNVNVRANRAQYMFVVPRRAQQTTPKLHRLRNNTNRRMNTLLIARP